MARSTNRPATADDLLKQAKITNRLLAAQLKVRIAIHVYIPVSNTSGRPTLRRNGAGGRARISRRKWETGKRRSRGCGRSRPPRCQRDVGRFNSRASASTPSVARSRWSDPGHPSGRPACRSTSPCPADRRRTPPPRPPGSAASQSDPPTCVESLLRKAASPDDARPLRSATPSICLFDRS